MALPFSGAALPLDATDLSSVASQIGCTVPDLLTVTSVETGGLGGFLPDGSGRPTILFEAAVFSRLTGHRYDSSHSDISAVAPDWHLYKGGAAEYDRLAEAILLDRAAALQATSWGMFQVMGENYRMLLFPTIEAMVTAMAHGEGAQLLGFGMYCMRVDGCAAALRDHNWDEFARLYNGPDYRRNDYAGKLAAAYRLVTGGLVGDLHVGCRGPQVMRLQMALARTLSPMQVDGEFGRVTELAVMRCQEARGIPPDGVVGIETARVLGLF